MTQTHLRKAVGPRSQSAQRFIPVALALAAIAAVLAIALSAPRVHAAEGEEPEVAEPVNDSTQTKDGLVLRYTFYPGKGDNKTVPIILLHGFKGQRGVYDAFASYLQRQGHAVIVPDLRGHGDSTRYADTEKPALDDPDRLKTTDFVGMNLYDLEAIKKLLMDKHNEGELNIELLCVVAADASTIVAVNWAVQDWSWPQLPSIKQGQDVKALVLLSPERSFKGYNCTRALSGDLMRAKYPVKLSILIAVGQKDAEERREARNLFNQLERAYPKPELPADPTPEDRFKVQFLYWAPADTELQGTELLDPRLDLGVAEFISDFIKYRLAETVDQYPWRERRSP